MNRQEEFEALKKAIAVAAQNKPKMGLEEYLKHLDAAVPETEKSLKAAKKDLNRTIRKIKHSRNESKTLSEIRAKIKKRKQSARDLLAKGEIIASPVTDTDFKGRKYRIGLNIVNKRRKDRITAIQDMEKRIDRLKGILHLQRKAQNEVSKKVAQNRKRKEMFKERQIG